MTNFMCQRIESRSFHSLWWFSLWQQIIHDDNYVHKNLYIWYDIYSWETTSVHHVFYGLSPMEKFYTCIFISESSNFISQDICIYLYTDLPWEWALVSESSNFISHVTSIDIYIQIYPESKLWSVSHLILYHRWYLLISIYRFTLSQRVI